MNITTGEKIQQLCDYYIGSNYDFNFNPIIRTQINKHINIEKYNLSIIKNLNVKNIFCYTHIIDGDNSINYNALLYILNNISTRFNIVFHNSDGHFLQRHSELLSIPNLNKIFTQNITIQPTMRICPLPIGIANSMWAHGNLNDWNELLKNNTLSIKTNYIFFNFKIDTNIGKRKKCFDIIQSKNIPNLPNVNYKQYLYNLSSYKFAICPEGNGLDTHRFWECLYLKVIPICLKNNITEHYSKIYPVILLNDWNDIDENMLKLFYSTCNWNNYANLSFDNIVSMFG